MDFDTWLDKLNQLGVFAPLDALRAHIDAAPRGTSKEETETVQLAERVWIARNTGGDIFSII